jgi:hypothetical protein
MVDTGKLTADALLDRRAKHLTVIAPHVPVFVCRNLLMLADRDLASAPLPQAQHLED